MSSRGGACLTMPGKALLDDPQFIRVIPRSTTRCIRGGKNFNLGFGYKVDHKVGSITRTRDPSGGLRRKLTPHAEGFEVIPRRWVIERTFGWLGRNRRLAKDFERLIEHSKAMAVVAIIQLLARRLATA